jgi:hypothetical protein
MLLVLLFASQTLGTDLSPIVQKLSESKFTEIRTDLEKHHASWSHALEILASHGAISQKFAEALNFSPLYKDSLISLKRELLKSPKSHFDLLSVNAFEQYSKFLLSLWLPGARRVMSVSVVGVNEARNAAEKTLTDAASSFVLGPNGWDLRRQILREFLNGIETLAKYRIEVEYAKEDLVQVAALVDRVENDSDEYLIEYLNKKLNDPKFKPFSSVVIDLKRKLRLNSGLSQPETSLVDRNSFTGRAREFMHKALFAYNPGLEHLFDDHVV